MPKQFEFFHPNDNGRAPSDDFPYKKKYLARNVPANFVECCEHIRAEHSPRRHRQIEFGRIYGPMLSILQGEDRSEGLDQQIGMEVFHVQVVFEAIQRTIDFNVPAKPIYERLMRLQRGAQVASEKLRDDERDRIIREYTGVGPDADLPRTMESFVGATSIGEKASIAGRIVEDIADTLEQLENFFNYKRGLVTKGQPSKYALHYAVGALAEIFERHHHAGRKAYVTQVDLAEERKGKNKFRYEGPFLDFVERFLWDVDAAEFARNSREGLHDRIRTLAANRKKDPDFFKLLHQETVPPEAILEFMKRADSIK